MQSVEEFMRGYFEALIAEEKRQQASHAPFRRRFYAEDCDLGSRPGILEMFQSEKVLTISNSDAKAEVVTTRQVANQPGNFYEMRYHLQAQNDSWIICGFDLRCCSCNAEAGKDDCPHCHGTGWRPVSRTGKKAT
jgi:hypothetical protein